VIVIAIGPPVAPETSYSGTAPPTVRVMDPNNPLRAGSNSRRLLESRKYQLYVQSTRNNTITTFTDEKDNPVAWFSGGSCGFKKVNRASYEAGCQCAMRIFNRIMEERRTVGPMSLEFFFKGFGQGRDALQKAMLGTDGEELRPLISRVTDRTPLKIGGTRRRRLDRDGCTKYM
jgi:small subunit ribosomal protein S11